MTCYFRHMKDIFFRIGVVVTTENKKQIDQKIHEMLGIKYKNCSETWKEIKLHLARDEDGFKEELQEVLMGL